MNVFPSDWFRRPSSDRRLHPGDDDRRLTAAAAPVLFLICLFLAHVYAEENLSFLSAFTPELARQLQQERQNQIYPVLVEQAYRPPVESQQIRALSDVSAQGTGGITALAGFHTLSRFDELTQPQAGGSSGAIGGASQQEPGESEAALTSANQGSGRNAPGPQPQELRIPANYRFRQDFLMRFDGSSLLSIPRQELAGFRYFQDMLRQIRENFSPPGQNYIYYDRAGYVLNQPIKPQVVAVQFRMDSQGNVTDVRVLSSLHQVRVDQACIDSLRGRNFGPPPPEVLRYGDIFGINFVFPPPNLR
ncbi:MAG: energy transducer TonB [Leptospirales bacterium]|nr:energy transducer TonB [Leptospirales bacterium]